ncbi:2-hydroxychromene-2-carboxylate isomerase [[Pseudomonas] carboxydohydrogena]|uniref:2-hydroxychromene-2-carboxylate isomerase n=1 Tax=Afipia carboxydohydrogena TaxID=290 RepID=A0ABY8BMY7_AFICR|nr:2-hydroxychromene-2-carboxylate isomerase [[Pseudomonas] carboxydohydrogena]WEF51350.1 2-hydroxychromene-2-carboxylate isomerase [[Pseudomonas] carboxydohydrogena]
MARSVEYYYSFQSPWAYIGHKPFLDLASAHGLAIDYKPVFLGELFSETGGLPLAKRHPLRQRYRMVELQRWREKRGLNFNLRPKYWPFSARLADGVAIAIAASGGNPEPFMRHVFEGIWRHELNLADPDTIMALADRCGLPGTALIERSKSVEVEDIYEQNRQDAIAHGVFGSPAYVLNGEVFWGQDRIDLLADALTSGRAPFRADE